MLEFVVCVSDGGLSFAKKIELIQNGGTGWFTFLDLAALVHKFSNEIPREYFHSFDRNCACGNGRDSSCRLTHQ